MTHTKSNNSQKIFLLPYNPAALARLAQGTSLTVACLLTIPDAVALAYSHPALLTWGLRVLELWLTAMILWFISFLSLLHLVKLFAQGIRIEANGLKLWRFGRFISWQTLVAVCIEPQQTFSKLFGLQPVYRLTLYVERKAGKLHSQLIPSYLFDDAEFSKLVNLICQCRFNLKPDALSVFLCPATKLADLKKNYAVSGRHRILLSVVIAFTLSFYLGKKALVNYTYSLANQDFRAQHYEKALAGYQHTVDLDPSFAAAWHNLAGSEFALGRTEQARLHWQKALFLKPDLVDAKVSLSYLYIHHRQFGNAQRLLNSALRFAPRNPGVLLNLADLNLRQGHIHTAIDYAHLILSQDPQNELATCLLAQARTRLGKDREAESLLQENHKTTDSPYCQLVVGEIEFKLKHWQEAAWHFNRVLKVNPENVDALIDLGHLKMMCSDLAGAESLFKQANLLAADDPRPLLLHAQLCLTRNDATESRTLLQRALSLDNQSSDTLAQAARLYLALGERSNAIRLAQQALKLDATEQEAWQVIEDTRKTPKASR